MARPSSDRPPISRSRPASRWNGGWPLPVSRERSHLYRDPRCAHRGWTGDHRLRRSAACRSAAVRMFINLEEGNWMSSQEYIDHLLESAASADNPRVRRMMAGCAALVALSTGPAVEVRLPKALRLVRAKALSVYYGLRARLNRGASNVHSTTSDDTPPQRSSSGPSLTPPPSASRTSCQAALMMSSSGGGDDGV
jgi:hypothetical protein